MEYPATTTIFKITTYKTNQTLIVPLITDFDTLYIRRRLKFNKSGKCINAFEVLSDARILRIAYDTIKSKPGNMVKGTIPETLDGINHPWF